MQVPAESAHTFPSAPPRFRQVCPSAERHWASPVHGVQLQGEHRPWEQIWPLPVPQSALVLHERHLGCESPPRPPAALMRAVAPMVTESPRSRTLPPAPPPPESLPSAQPRAPSARMVPLTVSEPVWAALAATRTRRPPPAPPASATVPFAGVKPSPSRQPLSPPAAPNSMAQGECWKD
ncbi:MAG: hypothetical protein QM765_17330 [Myxococcales bacterium]